MTFQVTGLDNLGKGVLVSIAGLACTLVLLVQNMVQH
jgi:hypothetical protein